MKDIYESILSSTNTGLKAMWDKLCKEHLFDCDFEVNGNKIKINNWSAPIVLIENGEMYFTKGLNNEIKTIVPDAFKFENFPILNFSYAGGPLPKCLYGAVFDGDENGYCVSVEENVTGTEMYKFIEELLHKTTCKFPGVSLSPAISYNVHNKNTSVTPKDLINHNYGGYSIAVMLYNLPNATLRLDTIKDCKCKKLLLGWGIDTLTFEERPSNATRTINMRSILQIDSNSFTGQGSQGIMNGVDFFDVDYIQKKLKEMSQANDIETLCCVTQSAQHVINIFWDKTIKKFNTRIEKAWAKRLGKFNKLK